MSGPIDYYVELSGPIAEPEHLRIFAELQNLPRLEAAKRRDSESSMGTPGDDAAENDDHQDGEPDQSRLELRRALSHMTTFAILDRSAYGRLMRYLAINHQGFTPIVLQMCRNPSLSGLTRRYPPNFDGTCASKPVTYPAPFLFYGDLLDPEKLAGVLGIHISVASQLQKAHTFGFELQDYGDYKKATRATLFKKLEGAVYWVENATEEATLTSYETNEYEIQECKICIGTSDEELEREVDGFIFVAKVN